MSDARRTTRSDAAPVVAIGLDAAEATLIERLCEERRMPTLQRLREDGRSGRVRPDAAHFLSAVWPTFSDSAPTGHHGWYYGKLWRPERMRFEYAADSWLPQSPFWERLPPDLRMAALDVPFVLRTPRRPNGWFVSGWQSHDRLGTFAHPRGAWGELRRRFGPPAMQAERFGEQSARSLLAVRREALDGMEQAASIGRWLLESERPDLLTIVIGGVHRGAHYLWDLSQIDAEGLGDEERRVLEGARDELYEAADRAVAGILDAAPEGVRVLVFALHGMGWNDGWADRFGELVDAIRRGNGSGDSPASGAPSPEHGLLYRLRRRVPWRLARPLTRRVPFAVERRLLQLWSSGMHAWGETRFFALPSDIHGFLRVNLRGRESAGVVEPGREYEELLAELEDAFRSFRAIETGEPVVRDVVRVDEVEAARGPRRRFLPDLMVHWNPISSQRVSGVVSDRCGEVRWERGAPFRSGRSGNHRPGGWLVAAGPGIDTGPPLECESVDLVPTLFRWLGLEPDPGFQGRPVPELVP